MASDKIVDWEVGSLDSSGNLIVNGNLTVGTDSADLISTTGITVSEGTTLNGDVVMSGLATSDPGVEGVIWSNSGVLTVSAGA